MVNDGKINRKSGKKILTAVFEEDVDPQEYADKNGLAQVSDASAIEPAIKKVIESNEKAVSEYLAGNEKNIQFLIGQSMRELRGKADPKTVKDILEKLLSEMK
jgi:aspartyl-tRNA(Asn)/glutamyl-tRNA(Gln) amidotransferase subunit B